MNQPAINSIVRVVWADIVHEDEDHWEDEIDKLEPFTFVSYGRLLLSDNNKVIIGSTEGQEDGKKCYRGLIIMPKSIVSSITEFKEEI